jgi:hypothetical protein
MYMSYVFLILRLLFLARKIAKTHIIFAQNFRKINANVKYIRYVFLILISIFQHAKYQKPTLF